MASVAKWLRQWIVVPPFEGSNPFVRPVSGISEKCDPLCDLFLREYAQSSPTVGPALGWF